MIASVHARSGFAAQLPALKKPLTFGSGLTILFGPNGCGKTTALRLSAAYAGCPEHGGWPSFVEPGSLADWSLPKQRPVTPARYPAALAHYAPRGCTADVEWDGTAAFLYVAAASEGLPSYFGAPSDGLTSDMERIFVDKQLSSGQRVLLRLTRIVERLKTPPDLAAPHPRRRSVNSAWSDAMDAFSDYVAALPRTGPATLLMDEPDRSLSIPSQAQVWAALPKIARGIQVIVASHSPFALRVKGATLIEMEKGYVEACRTALALGGNR